MGHPGGNFSRLPFLVLWVVSLVLIFGVIWSTFLSVREKCEQAANVQAAALDRFRASLTEDLRGELGEAVVNAVQELSKNGENTHKATREVATQQVQGVWKAPKFIPPIKKREGLGTLAKNEGFRRGAEVGVQVGLFSESLLTRWDSVEQFYCIDAWSNQANYEDIANVNQNAQDDNHKKTTERLAKFGGKVEIVKAFSNEAVHRFQNESLDFVYIDARHDYVGVTEDIQLYWPKVREGGILAGHDYLDVAEVAESVRQRWGKQDWAINPDGTRRTDGKAVKSAVNEFAVQVGRQVVVTYEDGYFPSWIIRK